MRDSRVTDQSATLRKEIDLVGYYPTVVADSVDSALAGEEVRAFVIHHEPTFDRDEVRRHVTVLVLTPSRLIVAHTDEHPPDDMLPSPYASTSTEAIPISRIGSVAVTRMVANPAESGPKAGVNEAVLAVGWGAVNRVDLEPATCGDPECTADHGYSGTFTSEDFALRISSDADGQPAVERLLEFSQALNLATTHST